MDVFCKRKGILKSFIRAWGIALFLFTTTVYAAEVTVNITPQTTTVREGRGVQINVTVSGSPECRVGIRSSGDAENNRDYTATPFVDDIDINLVTADASDAIGTGSTSFSFKAIADDVVEGNEIATFNANVRSPCTLSSNSTQARVTIIDETVRTNNLTASFLPSQITLQKGVGNTKISDIRFSLPTGKQPDNHCRAVARVNVVGGTAKSGVDFNFSPTVFNYSAGDGDSKTKVVNLEVLEGTAGSGDKTVVLEAVFRSNGAGGRNSCPLVGARSKRITVTLEDIPAVTPPSPSVEATASISATKSVVRENETVAVNYTINGDTASCTSVHPFVIANRTTASADQYQLNTDINLLESSTVPVKILKQASEEKVVVVGTRAEGCTLSVDNTVSFKIAKKAIPDPNKPKPLVRKEPEALQDNACSVLASKDKSLLTADDKSFFNSNCKGEGKKEDRNFEPEEVSVQTVAIVGAAGRQLKNIRSRLDRLRRTKGRRGIDVADATLNIQGATISVGLLGGAAGDDENSLLENSRWGFFANGDYAFGKEDRGNDLAQKGGDRNFDFNSTGLTFGADYRFAGEKMIAGAALGYKDFKSDFTTQSGGSNVKGYNLSVYGTYLLSDKAYLDATVGFGNNKLDARRPINNDGSGGIGNKTTFAIAKPNASEFVFSVGGGYEFYKGEWSLTPYGRMDYIKGTIDAYTESASHSSARTSLFEIDKQSIKALTSTFGLKTSRVISTSSGVFVPYASVEWKHDFKGRGAISGSSIYLNEKFTEGNRSDFDRNYYNLGVGVSAQFPKGKSAFLSVESRQGDSVVDDTAIRAGFRLEF